ncbi:hypothetical protein Sjap_025257 [Stephania japonica]|uniref:Uncharacterized protein n=1 Tax=Stephania japonica TaxID=461633 RepID=A0AAP0E1H3_9MAGN
MYQSVCTTNCLLSSKGSVSNTGVKEFKLNPGAKTFFPVFSVPRSPTPPAVATVTSMPYIQNNPPLIPVAVGQPEIGISPLAPRPSMPIKYVPYNNLVTLNGDNFSQYPQPIVGRGGAIAQPVRYAGQYNPVQAGPPPLALPTSQHVMVGRLGQTQIVYMHPASHDLIPGSIPPPQVTVRPLLTSQVPLIKQQATHYPAQTRGLEVICL